MNKTMYLKKSTIFFLCLSFLFVVSVQINGVEEKNIQKNIEGNENYQKNDTTKREYYQHRNTLFKNLNGDFKPFPRVVFFGDSITDAGEWGEFFPTISAFNRGIGGDSVTGLNARVDDSVIKLHPGFVFIMIGINDISYTITPVFYINEYRRLILTIKEKLPNTKIYIQSILPTRGWKDRPNDQVQQFNKLLKELCQQERVSFIDLYNYFLDEVGNMNKKYSIDGLHLSGEGYLLWISKIKECEKRLK